MGLRLAVIALFFPFAALAQNNQVTLQVDKHIATVGENIQVQVTLKDGTVVQGFPDSRESLRGTLVLVPCGTESGEPNVLGPYSVDDVVAVQNVPSTS